jgi:hypothetical protein
MIAVAALFLTECWREELPEVRNARWWVVGAALVVDLFIGV